MACVWAISGAGRGVGKTFLAQQLGLLLPGAVAAKLGHGAPKPGRPGNYFTSAAELAQFIAAVQANHQHVVVEANAWVRQHRADLGIFLEALPGLTQQCREDADQLAAAADICIGASCDRVRWQQVLAGKLADPQLVNVLVDLFAAQACRWHELGSNPGVAQYLHCANGTKSNSLGR